MERKAKNNWMDRIKNILHPVRKRDDRVRRAHALIIIPTSRDLPINHRVSI